MVPGEIAKARIRHGAHTAGLYSGSPVPSRACKCCRNYSVSTINCSAVNNRICFDATAFFEFLKENLLFNNINSKHIPDYYMSSILG